MTEVFWRNNTGPKNKNLLYRLQQAVKEIRLFFLQRANKPMRTKYLEGRQKGKWMWKEMSNRFRSLSKNKNTTRCEFTIQNKTQSEKEELDNSKIKIKTTWINCISTSSSVVIIWPTDTVLPNQQTWQRVGSVERRIISSKSQRTAQTKKENIDISTVRT